MLAWDCPKHHDLAASVPEDALPLYCECKHPRCDFCNTDWFYDQPVCTNSACPTHIWYD